MPVDLNEVRLRVLHGAVAGLRRWAALQATGARSAPVGAVHGPEWAQVFGHLDGMLAALTEPTFGRLDTYHAYRRLLSRVANAATQCRRNMETSMGLESHAWRLAAQELSRTAQNANRAPRWFRSME